MPKSTTKSDRLAPWRLRRKSYLLWFCAIVFSFFAVAGALYSNAVDYRKYEIDLSVIPDTALILESGLNRSDVAAIKLGHVERFGAYDVLLLGNHQFKYFNSNPLRKVDPTLSFFNLWYANLSVTELADLTEYLGHKNLLPKRLLIIQITSPNNDNGKYIVGRRGELLADIQSFSGALADPSLLQRVADLYEMAVNAVSRATNYATLLHALARRTEMDRLIDTASCTSGDGPVRDTTGVGTLLSGLMGAGEVGVCNQASWVEAFRGDGARDDRYVIGDPILNSNPLEPQSASLSYADIPVLAADMRRIHSAAEAAGTQAVFVLPPVYETQRPSLVNQVMDRVLDEVQNLNVLDHRNRTGPVEFFISYDHPSSLYFQFLINDLKVQGYLSDPIVGDAGEAVFEGATSARAASE
jgi:hypothetical protein